MKPQPVATVRIPCSNPLLSATSRITSPSHTKSRTEINPATDEIIDLLLDQPNFECDPVTRIDRDTPLHTAIRWLNGQPRANWPFGASLVDMMLEAGSSPRVKNKGGLTPLQLVDPANKELRDLIQKHEYAALNAGDFVNVEPAAPAQGGKANQQQHHHQQEVESDEDAEFSGSDDDERAEWERRRKERRAQRG